MAVEQTNKSKYLGDKLTLSQCRSAPIQADMWKKQIILFYIQKLYFTGFKALRTVLSESLTTGIIVMAALGINDVMERYIIAKTLLIMTP